MFVLRHGLTLTCGTAARSRIHGKVLRLHKHTTRLAVCPAIIDLASAMEHAEHLTIAQVNKGSVARTIRTTLVTVCRQKRTVPLLPRPGIEWVFTLKCQKA